MDIYEDIKKEIDEACVEMGESQRERLSLVVFNCLCISHGFSDSSPEMREFRKFLLGY